MRRFFIPALLAVGLTVGLAAVPAADAKDYRYGTNVKSAHGILKASIFPYFKAINEESEGTMNWTVFHSSQVVNLRTAMAGIRDNIVDAAVLVPVYSLKQFSAVNVMFFMQAFSSDPVAVVGAASEVIMTKCPKCVEQYTKQNIVYTGTYTTDPFIISCTKPHKSLAELKGKKIRGSGASARFAKMIGAVPVNIPPGDAVTALQRGALDCGVMAVQWLRGYGFQDVAKYVIDDTMGSVAGVGLAPVNRKVWRSFTPAQRKLMLKHMPLASSRATITGYIKEAADVKADVIKNHGVTFHHIGAEFDAARTKFLKQEEKVIAGLFGKKFKLKEAPEIIDTFKKALDKWHKISKEVGLDEAKFAAAQEREIYSKLNPEKM